MPTAAGYQAGVSRKKSKTKSETSQADVFKFLDSLKARGLNDAQLAHLSKYQKNKKGFKKVLGQQVEGVGKRVAASQGANLSAAAKRRSGRGKVNYRSTGGNAGDVFSRNNPGSLPNRAANVAGSAGRGAGNLVGAIGRRLGGKEPKKDRLGRPLKNSRR